MIVDLESVGPEPLRFEFTVDSDELDPEIAGCRPAMDATVSGELKKGPARVEVTGRITAAFTYSCRRCLRDVERRSEIELSVDFVSNELLPTARETQVSGRDLETDVLAGDELDLKELVREQIILDLPEQMLCREDCRGICERCGADLNEGDCDCRDDEIDPRWAALKQLK